MAPVFPVIYLLPTQLDSRQLGELEEQIPSLTYDVNEAEVIIGNVFRKERALFELRKLYLETQELQTGRHDELTPATKRKRLDLPGHLDDPGASLSVEPRGSNGSGISGAESFNVSPRLSRDPTLEGHAVNNQPSVVKVVNLKWLTGSLAKGAALPLADYIVYEGVKVKKTQAEATLSEGTGILGRALLDGPPPGESVGRSQPHGHGSRRRHNYQNPGRFMVAPILARQTTSEHENGSLGAQVVGSGSGLPPLPDYLQTRYSCCRPTPDGAMRPNQSFIEQLLKIRTARALKADKIGIRAYSTAIAAIAACPYALSEPVGERQSLSFNRKSYSTPKKYVCSAKFCVIDVARIPGCGDKIAELYGEWVTTGSIQEVRSTEEDPTLKILKLLYDIWGVGVTTARELFNKGCRDPDDVVEYHWGDLTRVQQIGVKFRDEFIVPIPRSECEVIAATILNAANGMDVHPEPGHPQERSLSVSRFKGGWELTIVGSYRRGRPSSGDVDVVMSHRSEAATRNCVGPLVAALERTGHITHTLTLSTGNSDRGQVPVSWKGNRRSGSGFDTLDKALVVWQDPMFDGNAAPGDGDSRRRSAGDGKKPAAKNPNLHRRVDIIISPWKTVGCAVLGWSGGTTFQRDLRVYCAREKKLKFDSSGIRSRVDGTWVDFETRGNEGRAPDMLTAEKRVFDGLGLVWREPSMRCTE